MKTLKKLYGKLLTLIPTRLPQGMTEFNTWADSIIAIGDLPTNNRDDIVFALATIIMHLGPQTAYKAKRYFILSIKAGAAKQVANAAFYEVKTKQQEKIKAEAAKESNTTIGGSNGVAQNS